MAEAVLMGKSSPAATVNVWKLMPVILIFWGSFAAVSKLTLGGIDSFQFQFYIFGIAALLMTIWQLIRRRLARIFGYPPHDILVALICGLPSYLYYFFYTLSLKLIPAAEASIINYLFPIMIVLFAIPINKEKLSAAKVLSLILGFIGTFVIMAGNLSVKFSLTHIAGDLLALGAAVAWGIFSNLGKWNKLAMEASIYLYVLESFVLSLISLIAFSRFILPGSLTMTGLLWISLSNIVLSYPLWIKVLKSAPVTLVATVAYITPFINLVFIMLLTGESLKPNQVIGLSIIVAAIAIQNLLRKKAPVNAS
jgi:drug/metabolite transporter (DMT)-like permease